MGSGEAKQLQEVIEVKGWLWEPPPDVAEALGADPALISDCLFFQLSHFLTERRRRWIRGNVIAFSGGSMHESLEEWVQEYRIPRNFGSEEGKEYKATYTSDDDDVESMSKEKPALYYSQQQLGSSRARPPLHDQNRMVLFVQGVRCYEMEEENESSSRREGNARMRSEADEPVQRNMKSGRMKMPAAHLLFDWSIPSRDVEKVLEHLHGEGIVSLGVPLENVVTPSLLQTACPALSHLLILMDDIDPEPIQGVCRWLPDLRGLAIVGPFNASSVKVEFLESIPLLRKFQYLGVSWLFPDEDVLQFDFAKHSKLECTGPTQLTLSGFPIGSLRLNEQWIKRYLRDSLSGTTTRLDLRDLFFENKIIEILLHSCFGVGTTSSVSDLGLRIERESTMRLLVGRSTSALSKLLVLRLSFGELNVDEERNGSMELLGEALSQPDCQVRFLDLDLSELRQTSLGWALPARFWSLLLQSSSTSRTPHPLQAVRIVPQECVQVVGGLADCLRSPTCSLVWLDFGGVEFSTTFRNEEEESELANSLTENFPVCTLSARWTSLAAKARASSLIRRNQVYRAGQLLEEEKVQPTSAKLFLCGHGVVGKTTLCRSLMAAQRSVMARPLETCGLRLGRLGRTRGMEFHSLTFGRDPRKLVICDLGGQEEFHAFHHYFMSASDNDLFVVVCRLSKELQQDVFRSQLEYWLRFIASHRSATSAASQSTSSANIPKVIVVANFFYSEKPHNMLATARLHTHELMSRFSTELDFGLAPTDQQQQASSYPNLFALVATKVRRVHPLRERLKCLLEENLQSGRRSLKLCNDISAEVLPSLMSRRRSWWASVCNLIKGGFAAYQSDGAQGLIFPYSTVLERYCKLFPADHYPGYTDKRIDAALQELHNKGDLVYFPLHLSEKKATAGTGQVDGSAMLLSERAGLSLVITDSGWFCSKLVGTLLATNLLQSQSAGHHAPQSTAQNYPSWLWRIEDIKTLLKHQGCKEEHLEQMVHYLHNLDLCFPTQSGDIAQCPPQGETWMLLFPTLMQDREIQYPQVISDHQGQVEVFFGRRLRCEETSLHLIPSGVFTRLQVRLQRFCENDPYALGCGWASLKKGNVGAVVRFGGPADRDGYWENKQWIDILILIPASRKSDSHSLTYQAGNNFSLLAGDRLMTEIKSLLYDICEAADFTGIPRVLLKEWILRSKDSPSQAAVPLSKILAEVRKQGQLESYTVAWPGPSGLRTPSTPVVELLLPTELQNLVNSQLTALANIRREFYISTAEEEEEGAMGFGSDIPDRDVVKGKGKAEVSSESEITSPGNLTGKELQLWTLIKERFDRVDRGMQSINENLHMIREDIGSLAECLRQAEKNIIATCSTRLLRHELTRERAYPLYPYLVDATDGKFKALQSLFVERCRLHFMCESLTTGPHPVDGQEGKVITTKVQKWLTRTARIMVPAFRVICCLARLAATVYLPSAHVFIPSPDCLSALGIDGEALQHEILPQALEALLKGVPDIDAHHQLRSGGMIQHEDVKIAMQGLLQNQSIDMAQDFKLYRVVGCGDEKTRWVCDEHIHEGTELQRISNPFKNQASS